MPASCSSIFAAETGYFAPTRTGCPSFPATSMTTPTWWSILLALYQATGERDWLDQAVIYNDAMLEQFWDREQSIFFLTGKEHEELVTPVRDAYDNATPAGSSVAVFNLLKLAVLTGNLEYRSIAETNLENMHLPLTRYPNGFGYLLGAADFYLGPVKEIAVVGDPESDETQPAARGGSPEVPAQQGGGPSGPERRRRRSQTAPAGGQRRWSRADRPPTSARTTPARPRSPNPANWNGSWTASPDGDEERADLIP